MTRNVKSLADLLPEELVRLLFNKLARTYPLVTEEWRAKKRPLLEALIAYEYDEKIAAAMRDKYKDVLEDARPGRADAEIENIHRDVLEVEGGAHGS
jgi:hypothetical protein